MTRKPSCLISCSHSAPVGGCGALLGRQGGTKPPSQGAADHPVRCNHHREAKERRKEQTVVGESSDGTHASERGQAD
jgi:hypothetical protein